MTDQKLNAATLLGHGKTAIEVAGKAGVSIRTIFAWKAEPDFATEILRVQTAWREKARKEGLADQDVILRSLNDRYNRLRNIITARGLSPDMQTAPGGTTGLMTVTYKMLSRVDQEGNKVSEPVPEYAVDTGMLAEMRALEVQMQTIQGRYKIRSVVETRKTVDATPAAIGLALLMSTEQLEELAAKATAFDLARQALGPGIKALLGPE